MREDLGPRFIRFWLFVLYLQELEGKKVDRVGMMPVLEELTCRVVSRACERNLVPRDVVSAWLEEYGLAPKEQTH